MTSPDDIVRLRRRYLIDGVFHRLVDGIRAALREDIITPGDVTQALDLAVDLNREADLADLVRSRTMKGAS